MLDGSCPPMLQDLLEVRGLGILNVREMFGHTAVKRNKYLRLLVHLAEPGRAGSEDAMARLTGMTGTRHVLDVEVPQITIPVAPGRNLAVLVESRGAQPPCCAARASTPRRPSWTARPTRCGATIRRERRARGIRDGRIAAQLTAS